MSTAWPISTSIHQREAWGGGGVQCYDKPTPPSRPAPLRTSESERDRTPGPVTAATGTAHLIWRSRSRPSLSHSEKSPPKNTPGPSGNLLLPRPPSPGQEPSPQDGGCQASEKKGASIVRETALTAMTPSAGPWYKHTLNYLTAVSHQPRLIHWGGGGGGCLPTHARPPLLAKTASPSFGYYLGFGFRYFLDALLILPGAFQPARRSKWAGFILFGSFHSFQ